MRRCAPYTASPELAAVGQNARLRTAASELDATEACVASTVGEAAETAGAGAAAVVAVLAPVLAATAAAIFLLVGFILPRSLRAITT